MRLVSSCVSSKVEGPEAGGVRKEGGVGGIELRGWESIDPAEEEFSESWPKRLEVG